MNLVDSSGWLEYFADSNNADIFSEPIEDTENLLVSTLNIYEVFKRVFHQRGEDSALQAIALMYQAEVVDVTSEIAISAAKLSYEKKLPMADSIILITARMNGAVLWTQDSDFQNFEDVKYFNQK